MNGIALKPPGPAFPSRLPASIVLPPIPAVGFRTKEDVAALPGARLIAEGALRLVRYALAVRLARADRYAEAAEIYPAIGANRRAARMRRLADLFAQTNDQAIAEEQRMEAQYRFAEVRHERGQGVRPLSRQGQLSRR